MYLEVLDQLLKCYNCGRCYYLILPSPISYGPKGKRVVHGGWHFMRSKPQDTAA